MGLWRAKQPSGVTAAAGPMTRASLNSAINRSTAPMPWQDEIEMYDEWGPGFVGSYLDLVADKVTICGAVLYDGDQPVQDQRMQSIWEGVWRTWRGRYSENDGLLRRHTRLRMKQGEAWVLLLDDGTRAIAHRKELNWQGFFVEYRDPVTEKLERIPIEDGRVWRSWQPLDRDPRFATCDLQRALPHIREYINVKRRQDADTTSPLVRNKILLFAQGTEQYAKGQERGDEPYDGMPDAFVDYLKIAQKQDVTKYHDKRRGVDTVPFPMIGGKIETVDMGRDSDPQSEKLEDAAIFAFARSVRTPVQYIHSGPGVAKFDNEAFVLEALITDAVQPTANAVLADIWRVAMRQVFYDTYIAIVGKVPPGKLRLGPDLDRIRSKVDNTRNMMQAYKLGAVTRDAVADAVDAEMMALPDNMTEFDLWKLVAGVQAEPASAGPGAVPAVPAAGVAAAVAAAPTQLALTAAPSPIEQLLRDGEKIDHTLVVALTAAAAMAYQSTIDNAARRLSRIAPSGSDLKARLAAANTSAEKLAQVTEADIALYGITPEMLVTDDDYQALAAAAENDLRHALEAFAIALVAATGGSLPQYRFREGARALAAGLRDYTRYRIGAGGHQTDPTAELPTGIVRRALSVAGGQADDASIQAGAAGGPLTRDAIEDGGPALTYTWRHAFYRVPMKADAVHLSFNGYVASSFDEFGVRYPGDHYNCTCAITLGLA